MRVIDFKDASCRHCYKCVRHCEVKAISVQNEQAHIMKDHCINCGHCLEVCPQNAKKFASDMDRVRGYLRQGMKVIISIAPSYLGVLDYERPGQVVSALKKLGFYAVRETAEGAALVTAEYQKLLRAGEMPNIITTCCPSVNDLIEKYYPELVPLMAPVVSPMIAHGRLIRQIYGEDVKVVFLGPCIAKKSEALDLNVKDNADYVLNLEEIYNMIQAKGVDLEPEPNDYQESSIFGKRFGNGGGVTNAVLECMQEAGESTDGIKVARCSGAVECKKALLMLKVNRLPEDFIEGMACVGGCVGGPSKRKAENEFKKDRDKLLGEADGRKVRENLKNYPMDKFSMHRH